MKTKAMKEAQISSFQGALISEERSRATIEKYLRDVRAFYHWLPAGKPLTKELVMAYKAQLSERYAPASINSMLVAINRFLCHIGLRDCLVKTLKIQRRIFSSREQELSKADYLRLLRAARGPKYRRVNLIMQTICSTGIRVSELQSITVAALRRGRADVDCKNKHRVIFLPTTLCRLLTQYAGERGIVSGAVFVTSGGKPIDRSNIWAEMKRLCAAAEVAPSKVFPHNLRHLFARSFYALDKDLARLADILGHSSMETTRIYTISSGSEHESQMERLGLVV